MASYVLQAVSSAFSIFRRKIYELAIHIMVGGNHHLLPFLCSTFDFMPLIDNNSLQIGWIKV